MLSEVFLQAARALPRFRGDDEHLRAWLFTITRHRVIDAHRRRQARPLVSDAAVPDQAAPDRAAPIDPELVAALGRLTPEQREVVVLRFVSDLSLDEVASITGRNPGAVKAMQHRALAQLARILEDPSCAPSGDG